jgi:predicted nuclease of predicted toxin-antitoxin system
VQQLFPNGLDLQILDYAVANGYLVLTKDLDFIDLATFRGAPAKVVRIALGNCRTENVAALVMTEHEIISEFAGDPTALHLSLPGRRSQ